MSDISAFLQFYNEALQREIAEADMPPELMKQFTFDSLEKKKPDREVYFVTEKADGKRAVLHVTAAGSPEDAAAEGEVLKRLDHPSVPKLLGLWEYKGRSYLAREYIEGSDLGLYIRQHGLLSRERLTAITLRLCDILSYLHEQNPPVIHRDIKPGNIVLSGWDEVKLIDFGIARRFQQEEGDTEDDRDIRIAGMRPYMAPEQFGSEQTDSRADIYSLGVVMIFMATGRPDRRSLKSTYPYKGLMNIIQKCIRKDRSQRYRTAAQLKRRILWEQRRMTEKLLFLAGALVALAAAFFAGLFLGRTQGFVEYKEGVYGAVNERGDIGSLTDIPDMYYLKVLELISQNISDLTPLGGMKLERLVLCDNYIGNLLPLKDMATLKELDLCENPLWDLTPLRELFSLTYLDVSQSSVTDLSPLSRLSRLETLNLVWCDVKDLRALEKLSRLKEVDVSHTAVTDLRTLVREGEPVTVRCAGLPAETIDAVRGMNITLAEEWCALSAATACSIT